MYLYTTLQPQRECYFYFEKQCWVLANGAVVICHVIRRIGETLHDLVTKPNQSANNCTCKVFVFITTSIFVHWLVWLLTAVKSVSGLLIVIRLGCCRLLIVTSSALVCISTQNAYVTCRQVLCLAFIGYTGGCIAILRVLLLCCVDCCWAELFEYCVVKSWTCCLHFTA